MLFNILEKNEFRKKSTEDSEEEIDIEDAQNETDLKQQKENQKQQKQKEKEEKEKQKQQKQDEEFQKQKENEQRQFDQQPRREIVDFETLKKLIVTRDFVSQKVDEPFFEKLVTNLFVRVATAQKDKNNNNLYRIAEIVGFSKKERSYMIGPFTTNISLQLGIGTNIRNFGIDVLSNKSADINEYNYWKEMMRRSHTSGPTKEEVQRKINEMDQLQKI